MVPLLLPPLIGTLAGIGGALVVALPPEPPL